MDENNYPIAQETTNPSPATLPQITEESIGYLNTVAKWTKFFAVLGFVGVGLMILIGLSMGIIFSLLNNSEAFSQIPIPTHFLGFIYIVIAAVYLMPVIYLNNFSNNLTNAISMRNTDMLTVAFYNLKRHFKFMGIMTIVMIISYFVLIIGVVAFTMHSAITNMNTM
ncbi:MAG: hypothetical protein Q8908_17045 [Bacteroidota bacterium]|nr:hypothetical protein [Bacteroidota bacterium]